MKIEDEQSIFWKGDLKDDCLARWRGILLRAEWIHEYYCWCVYDIEKDATTNKMNLSRQSECNALFQKGYSNLNPMDTKFPTA